MKRSIKNTEVLPLRSRFVGGNASKAAEEHEQRMVQENASNSMSTMTLAMKNTETGSNLIKERQQKRQKVQEQFLREA